MKLLLGLLAVLLVALLATEVTMQPESGDRIQLLGMFAGSAGVTGVVGIMLARVVRRLRSLRQAVLLTAVAAVAAAALTVAASVTSMLLSTHELKLVLVAMGIGAGLGVVLAAAVAQPLEMDLAAIRATADRAGRGDLTVRTGVSRPDEVGLVAKALDAAIAQLDAADQARALMEATRREFFAAVSHDLRTPLTSLQGALEALTDGVAPDPDRYLAAMRGDVALMASLVEDLFLLARIESGGMELTHERVDLAEIADEALEAMTPVAGRRDVGLVLDANGSAPVHGSARELSRILRNLVDNAIRHAPPQTTVTIRTRTGAREVELLVTDEGPGFPDEFRARAFESFSRADDARARDSGGAGLGLSIARGLVELHGGRIEALAGPGGRVAMWLPSDGRGSSCQSEPAQTRASSAKG